MLARGLKDLQPPLHSVVMIENVGNLVCPALFDLGEHCKVAILSVTEGEDKPVKYPHMFSAAKVMLLNKADLLPHLDFNVDQCVDYARQVNPEGEGRHERRRLWQKTACFGPVGSPKWMPVSST